VNSKTFVPITPKNSASGVQNPTLTEYHAGICVDFTWRLCTVKHVVTKRMCTERTAYSSNNALGPERIQETREKQKPRCTNT
jgi:hypothetical protein